MFKVKAFENEKRVKVRNRIKFNNSTEIKRNQNQIAWLLPTEIRTK